MLHVDSSSASDSTATAFFKGRIVRVDGAAASNSPRLNLSLDGTDKTSILLNRTDSSLAIETLTSAPIIFDTNSTERVRIQSTGGISFNGDTAAANALDDYEEGTFTPSFGFNLANFNGSYSAQGGRYTKIGNLVSISMQIEATKGTGTGGTATIYNIPFTPINEDNARASGSVGFYNGFTCTRPIVILVEQNQTQFPLRHSGSSQATSIGASDMASSFRIYISVTYFTA
tara:strand:- start:76 stop:765 length:690 start_codon:yes stop_codon:yes gene_type:complete